MIIFSFMRHFRFYILIFFKNLFTHWINNFRPRRSSFKLSVILTASGVNAAAWCFHHRLEPQKTTSSFIFTTPPLVFFPTIRYFKASPSVLRSASEFLCLYDLRIYAPKRTGNKTKNIKMLPIR